MDIYALVTVNPCLSSSYCCEDSVRFHIIRQLALEPAPAEDVANTQHQWTHRKAHVALSTFVNRKDRPVEFLAFDGELLASAAVSS